MTKYITDEELRALLRSELDAELIIDSLNRKVETQKPEGRDARDRSAVEAELKALGLTFNHEQR